MRFGSKPEHLKRGAQLWQELGTSAAAAAQLSAEYGERVTASHLRELLLAVGVSARSLGLVADRREMKQSFGAPPSSTDSVPASPTDPERGRSATLPDDVLHLVKVVKKSPTLEEVCNALNLSPARAHALVDRARGLGVQLQLDHDRIGIAHPEPRTDVQQTGVPPVVGPLQRVGVASDLHCGSKYCLRPQLWDFVDYAYSLGVRHILVPGDLIDGDYKFARFEHSHSGLDAQADDLAETLPQKEGLVYHAITGNHDGTFAEASGLDVGTFLEERFARGGRRDLRIYGARGAFISILGAIVHMWHPRSHMSYARSYALQKQVERYSPGEKPHILLAGHWHQFCWINERGVDAIACPTFQGGGSAFAKSIGGHPALGGLVLSWSLTEHGTMRDLIVDRRQFFEREQPRDISAPVGV